MGRAPFQRFFVISPGDFHGGGGRKSRPQGFFRGILPIPHLHHIPHHWAVLSPCTAFPSGNANSPDPPYRKSASSQSPQNWPSPPTRAKECVRPRRTSQSAWVSRVCPVACRPVVLRRADPPGFTLALEPEGLLAPFDQRGSHSLFVRRIIRRRKPRSRPLQPPAVISFSNHPHFAGPVHEQFRSAASGREC